MWIDRASDRTLSLLLFVSAAFWGLYWVPVRALQAVGFNEAMSVVVFNALPLLVLVPLMALNWQREGAHLGLSCLVGLFLGLGLASYATGLVASSVVRVTLLFYLTPVWATLIGLVWLGERLSIGRVLAIVLGLGGMVALISGAAGGGVALGVGDALGLLSGISWAIGSAGLKRWPQVPSMASTTWQFGFVCLFAMLFGLLLFEPGTAGVDAFVSVAPLVIGSAALVLLPTTLLILRICQRLFPGRAGLLMMSEVIVAIVSAAVFLPDETMSLVQWIGGGLIIAACLCEILLGEAKG